MTGGSPICRKRPVVFCPSAELFHIWIQRAIIDGAPARVDIGFLSSNGRLNGSDFSALGTQAIST